jgi:hypothetical protein
MTALGARNKAIRGTAARIVARNTVGHAQSMVYTFRNVQAVKETYGYCCLHLVLGKAGVELNITVAVVTLVLRPSLMTSVDN